MQLYLMRHGEAVSPHSWHGPDADRPLIKAGISELKAAVKEWIRVSFRPEAMWASPYKRAQQTAEILSAALTLPFETKTELSAGGPHKKVKDVLPDYADKSSLLIVGHMPDVAILAGRFTGEPSLLDTSLAPGEILALDVDPTATAWGVGKFLWRRELRDWKSFTQVL